MQLILNIAQIFDERKKIFFICILSPDYNLNILSNNLIQINKINKRIKNSRVICLEKSKVTKVNFSFAMQLITKQI